MDKNNLMLLFYFFLVVWRKNHEDVFVASKVYKAQHLHMLIATKLEVKFLFDTLLHYHNLNSKMLLLITR